MKILFVIAGPFLPEEYDGQNRTIQELCSELTSIGHSPTVISGWRSPEKRRSIFNDRSLGYSVYRTTDIVSTLPGLTLTLRPHVVVVVDCAKPEIFQKLLNLKIPLVNWLFQKTLPNFQSQIRSVRTIATTSEIATASSIALGQSVGVIHPFINISHYQSESSGDKVLLVNPSQSKGGEWFIKIARQRPQYRFIVLQSSLLARDWRQHLFDQFRTCGNIEVLPPTQNIMPVFQSAALLLLPRYQDEGFARVVTEAQLSGLPVMGFNAGGVAENIGVGGSLFNLDDNLDSWLKELDRYKMDEAFHALKKQQAIVHSRREAVNPQNISKIFLNVLTDHVKSCKNKQFYGSR